MNRIRWAAVLVAGLATAGVACSSSDYSKDDFEQDLESEVDLSPAIANCVADGVDEAGIDISKFDTDKSIEDVLDPEEQQRFTEVITTCVVQDPDNDPGDLPETTDLTVPD